MGAEASDELGKALGLHYGSVAVELPDNGVEVVVPVGPSEPELGAHLRSGVRKTGEAYPTITVPRCALWCQPLRGLA